MGSIRLGSKMVMAESCFDKFGFLGVPSSYQRSIDNLPSGIIRNISQKPVALITGAAGGIGKAIAV